jgi:hypothetical protein
MTPTNTHAGRWAAIYEAMTGATAPGGHHEGPVGTDPVAIKAGHEADAFDARGIVLVPFLVVGVAACAYILVTVLFGFFSPGAPMAGTNPAAAADNAKSFNERVSRISSSDPNAEVKHPRLEYIRSIETKREGTGKDDPPFLRSFPSSAENNTYELKPQDLYPESFVDPATGKRILADYEWISKDKVVARIPVDEAMKILAHGKLPHKDGKAQVGTRGKATQGNGGHPVKPTEVPAVKDDHKH